MNLILLRVELRSDDPAGELWQRLDSALNKAGFAKTVQRSDGTRFKLPQGEYRASQDAAGSLSSARDAATQVVRAVDADCGLLLTQVDEWVGVGLKIKM